MTEIPPIHETPPALGQVQAVETVAPGKGMAITAMILGIVSIVFCLGPLAGIPAIVLSIIVLAKNKAGKGMAIAGLTTGGLGLILGAIILGIFVIGHSVNTMFEELLIELPPNDNDQLVCYENLEYIGTAAAMYSVRNQDVYPPTLQHIIDSGQSEDILQCPSENTDRVDYFYMQPSADAPNNTIIACDYLTNHQGEVRNVLFLDSHIERHDEESFQKLLTEPQNLVFAEKLRVAEFELDAADRALQYQNQYE